jgi:hypothetical protein
MVKTARSGLLRMLLRTCWTPFYQRTLLGRLRPRSDMILTDTAPAFQLTDSRISGRLADRVILIARDWTIAIASPFIEDRTYLMCNEIEGKPA